MEQKYKWFNFGMKYGMYGIKSIKVPVDFTKEQAEEYVREHWDDIDLPCNAGYMFNSAAADFDCSNFEEGSQKEE
ncbi:MAG: hypothetical protein IJ709_10645 [Selenomonas sp.]|nr:hypothetical protein [Selenomonas sp.]